MNAHVPHSHLPAAPHRPYLRVSLRARIVLLAILGGIIHAFMVSGFMFVIGLGGADFSEQTFYNLVIAMGLGGLLTFASAVTVFLSLGLTRVISGIAVASDVTFWAMLLAATGLPNDSDAGMLQEFWSLIVILVLSGILLIGPPLMIALASPKREMVPASATSADPDAGPELVPAARRTLPDSLVFAASIGAVLAFIGLPLAGEWDNWAIFLLALGMLYAPRYAHWISGGLTVIASLRLIAALVTSPGATGVALVVLALSLAMHWLTLRGQGALNLRSSENPESYLA